MTKQMVLIVGSSGHAAVVIDIFEKQKEFKIVGLLDSSRKQGDETLGYKILGNDENLPMITGENPGCKLFVAIGDNWKRRKVVEKICSQVPDVNFASAVHPSAVIAKGVTIGKGVAIMAGAVVNSNTLIGDFAIINTRASIDHDSKMLSYSSLAPGVTTGGKVTIGECSAISIGAIIKHGVSVGNHSVLGAGALLLEDCGDNIVMYGSPAKAIRKRAKGEGYL